MDRGVNTTSSQSSQTSSTAAGAGAVAQEKGMNVLSKEQQQQQHYPSDDEYFSDNANAWLLKESSNYTPWGVNNTILPEELSSHSSRRRTDQNSSHHPNNSNGTPLTHPPVVVTPDSNNCNDTNHRPISHLFTLPPVEDRSERRRVEYEQSLRNSGSDSTPQQQQQHRRRGLYEGELEPEGVRGQEATGTTSSNGGSTFLPSSSTTKLQIIKPVTPTGKSTIHHQLPALSKQTLVNIPEESHDSSSASYDATTNDEQQKQKQMPTAVTTPADRDGMNIPRSNTAAPKSPRHQNRPSRLVSPPPSRVASSPHYNHHSVETKRPPTAAASIHPTIRTDKGTLPQISGPMTNSPTSNTNQIQEESMPRPVTVSRQVINLQQNDNDIP
jgi:hypothetical protein